jgi:2-phosphosulfolactate phosphatase
MGKDKTKLVQTKIVCMSDNIKITCEWGIHGLNKSEAEVIIIVDVLSFSTCVDIVVSKGGIVFPYTHKDESAIAFAAEKNAILALPRNMPGYTLSPTSLINIPNKTKLVLPSPNGSTIAFKATAPHILAGCLRNASAIATAAMKLGKRIHLIPAGEKWSDGSMRVSYEDLIGAGAIIHALTGEKTEEASTASIMFIDSQQQHFQNIYNLHSGLELINWSFRNDIDLACQYDISTSVPVMQNGFFVGLKI